MCLLLTIYVVQESCYQYWPSGSVEQYGEYFVSCQSVEEKGFFIERKFSVHTIEKVCMYVMQAGVVSLVLCLEH